MNKNTTNLLKFLLFLFVCKFFPKKKKTRSIVKTICIKYNSNKNSL